MSSSLSLSLSLSIFWVMSCLLITLNKSLKGHKSLGLLLGCVFKMSLSLSLSLSLCLSLYCLCICLCLFFGQVMSPHHSDQMSQRSQVSKIAHWRCSLNVFVFVIVFVFVFAFVFVFVFFFVFDNSDLFLFSWNPMIICFDGFQCLFVLSANYYKLFLHPSCCWCSDTHSRRGG